MNKLWMILLMFSLAAVAADKEIYVTIDSDAVASSQKSLVSVKKMAANSGITVLKIKESDIENLSHMMHEDHKRCGGFVFHESKAEALAVLENNKTRKTAKNMLFTQYTMTETPRVESMLTQVNELTIRETIISLSKFHNRYYNSKTGVESQAHIKGLWEKLSQGRSDTTVEFFNHSSWKQPSVIMTIAGSSKADEIIVIGGHADSIAGWWGKEKARAPGADDNASGIATITEIIKVLMDNNYKPQRTIQFMAYAAEEVGLRGSKAIAKDFKNDKKDVVGVVQFDMTNHNGSSNLDIVFMSDYTNQAQTKFMGALIDKYLSNVTWGYSKCGYACSDHASWHNAGYPASMPFESTMGDINSVIHSKKDTIDHGASAGNADHAEKFARLGLAFAIEMGK
jgi:bacterial leucyl aminopeptidase